MPTYEKKIVKSWQVKTEDGVYYQSDSLNELYQWLCENRLGGNDFIFDTLKNDWINLVDMPDLADCFCKMMKGEDDIYGPISLGELKQLYKNNQVTGVDRILLKDKSKWAEISRHLSLWSWIRSEDITVSDYEQLVSGFAESVVEGSHGQSDSTLKEKSILLEKECEEQRFLINDLKTACEHKDNEISKIRIAMEEVDSW